MRVCLVIPPSGFLLDERVFPSLGVLKVAAVLEQAGHAVRVLDLSGRSAVDMETAVVSMAAAFTPAVWGLTATMPQMPAAAKIAYAIRRWVPTARIVLGGPHVTLLQAAARGEQKRGEDGRAIAAVRELTALFDVLVCGDGERAVFAALDPNAPAIIDADDPASAMFLTPDDLTAAPLPARHLINLDSYRFEIEGRRTVSLIAQLGCPFGCGFCGGRKSPFLRRVRTRTTASVIAEMRHLYETYGATGFMFLDDELNVNRSFLELLAAMRDLQTELGVAFRMRGLLKSELFTPEQAAAMHAAGFRELLIGFESGSPRMLWNMQKRATVEDNTRAVAIARDAGLRVKALMSIGHPGESAETIAETRAWLLAVQPDQFDVTIITVYPGTPYHDEAIESSPDVWTYRAPKTGDALHSRTADHLRDVPYYKGIPGAYQAFVWTDALSSADLVAFRDAVEDDVRAVLGIPYPTGPAALQYEHSMGLR